VTSVNH